MLKVFGLFIVLIGQIVGQAVVPNHVINQQIVDQIRVVENNGWEAWDPESNPMRGHSEQELIGLCGTILEPRKKKVSDETVAAAFASQSYPREFDSRKVFSECKHPIRDQKKCGSCWAFSVAETWADNACIVKINGATNETIFSTEDLLACATFGSGKCGGGRINYAFDYVISDGLVTEKCFPYTSQNGSVSACPAEVGPNMRTCPVAGQSWKSTVCSSKLNDLFTPDLMKYGIMKLGAVATGYTVFEDFYNYKSGIYRHVSGKMLGGHAIKVVGWGVQNATANMSQQEYWIVANSWGGEWGEEGYFRFSFNDTDCHFAAGGSYNCGENIVPPSL